MPAKLIGEGRFETPMEFIAGEHVVWEGGADRRGGWLRAIRIMAFVAIPIALLVLMFVFAAVMDSAETHRPARESTATRPPAAATVPPRPQDPRGELVVGFAFGLMALIFLAATAPGAIGAVLDARHSWYVVTNERICVQSGALARHLAVVDLDKIVSVQASSSWLERRYGLQTIDLIHAGQKPISASGFRQLIRDPLAIAYVDARENLLSRLLADWLPRDNRRPTP